MVVDDAGLPDPSVYQVGSSYRPSCSDDIAHLVYEH